MSASFENYKEHMLNVSVDIFAPYVLRVIISHVPESSSLEERMVELQVKVRGQVSQTDLLIRLLEFLKLAHHVSLVSMDANTHIAEGNNALHQLSFRLRIIQVCVCISISRTIHEISYNNFVSKKCCIIMEA